MAQSSSDGWRWKAALPSVNRAGATPLEELLLKKRFEQVRWNNIVKRSEAAKLSPPDKEALWEKVLKSYRNGFRCAYCERKLEIVDRIYPHKRSFSLDHKTPISCGGDNSIDNLEVVCHECDIIKSTMTSSTFLEFLQALKNSDPTLLERVYTEIWNGRMANKLGNIEGGKMKYRLQELAKKVKQRVIEKTPELVENALKEYEKELTEAN